MRRAADGRTRLAVSLAGCACLLASVASAAQPQAGQPRSCQRAVYLTIDTGHMGVAPLVADVLQRHGVKATFFLANERTQAVGGRPAGASLDAHWAAWWQALARQGHDFGSHSWDHVVWQADLPGGFRVKPTAGPQAGQRLEVSHAAYCEQLARLASRWRELTGGQGSPMRALFRAPGGRTSKALLSAARRCGWTHVSWSPNGFLGDELDSDRHPNPQLLQRALRSVREGDILLMHLGIWSRQDPWAPAVLEPLIVGLKAKGLCFATLREHPDFAAVGPAPMSVAAPGQAPRARTQP